MEESLTSSSRDMRAERGCEAGKAVELAADGAVVADGFFFGDLKNQTGREIAVK